MAWIVGATAGTIVKLFGIVSELLAPGLLTTTVRGPSGAPVSSNVAVTLEPSREAAVDCATISGSPGAVSTTVGEPNRPPPWIVTVTVPALPPVDGLTAPD